MSVADRPPDWSQRIVGLYNKAVVVLASILMSGIIIIMSVQIFYRYALNDSLIWAEETCRYLLVLISFLFIGAAFQRGDLVSFGFVTAAMPRRLEAAVRSLFYVVFILFLGLLSYYCYRFALLSSRFAIPSIDFIMSSLTGREVSRAVSMYWLYLVMPLGFGILSIHFAVALVHSIRIAAGLTTDTDGRAS